VSVADVLFVLLGLVAFAAGWHAAEFVPVDRGGLAAACFLVATGGLSLVAAGAVGWADGSVTDTLPVERLRLISTA
jgi:hypothetical protein